MRDRPGESFRCELVHAGGCVYEVAWHGHVTARDAEAACAQLSRAIGDAPDPMLLIDATGITGFDADARIRARAWALSEPGSRVAYAAVVAHSQLAAVESPAAALAPVRRARLFGSRAAAQRYLAAKTPVTSGEYPVASGAVAAAAAVAQRRNNSG